MQIFLLMHLSPTPKCIAEGLEKKAEEEEGVRNKEKEESHVPMLAKRLGRGALILVGCWRKRELVRSSTT